MEKVYVIYIFKSSFKWTFHFIDSLYDNFIVSNTNENEFKLQLIPRDSRDKHNFAMLHEITIVNIRGGGNFVKFIQHGGNDGTWKTSMKRFFQNTFWLTWASYINNSLYRLKPLYMPRFSSLKQQWEISRHLAMNSVWLKKEKRLKGLTYMVWKQWRCVNTSKQLYNQW